MSSSVESDEKREAYEQRVLSVVRDLALEVRGPRALQAVTPTASLERHVGFGSLERVELLTRLEAALGRELDDQFLRLDTPREIAAAAVAATSLTAERPLPPLSAPVAPSTALDVDALTTVVDALWLRAASDPARTHAYLDDGAETSDVSFGALRSGAAGVAAGLAERGLRPGERVAIMLPTGFDFLQSFMGAIAAGLVPVPLYPPARLDRLQEYLLRQSRILANAGARLLITVPEAASLAEVLRRNVPTLTGVATTSQLANAGGASERQFDPYAASPDDLALIQYTSGSTGDPKGVCLTHGNLLANIRAMAADLSLGPTDVGVSWLPLYHDMGLIGAWLNCLVHGVPIAIMSPLSFLARPERWLWTIHQRRATLSPAPNFAYELCLRKVRDEAIEGLDLSSWRCALNGAEPVSVSTVERFARRFERYGFDPNAMMPVYGLAECAVALAFPPTSRGVRVDRVVRTEFEGSGRATPAGTDDTLDLQFVSVGRPLPKHEVRIIDEHDRDVADRIVGRLVFRGPSATTRYFNNPDATSRTVRADGWVESGDLAYRADGELYIAGRAKDLIIKGGRNVMPQEIEEIVGTVDGVRKGCVVAFGVPDENAGTERLVVVAEAATVLPDSDTRERLEGAVIRVIAEGTGVPPDVVEIVPPRAVPKTSSGKLRRAETKTLYLAGRLGTSAQLPLSLRARVLHGWITSVVRRSLSRFAGWLFASYLTVAGTIAALMVGVPMRILLALLPGRKPAFTLARLASRIALRIAWCRVTVDGLERLPRAGPMVLVSNHAAPVDIPALLASLAVDFVFVAKREALSLPFVGAFLRKARHLTVERLETAQSVADSARITDALRSDEMVLFFPEGTFTRAVGLRPFRMGAFEAAAATGAPVIPIALRGTRRVLPSGKRIPRPGPISIWIGEPLVRSGNGWRAALDLRDRAADVIARHCGEPRLDLVVGGVERPNPAAATAGNR